MSEEQKPVHANTVVVFNISEDRRKAKKDATKKHRDFIRDRQREKLAK